MSNEKKREFWIGFDLGGTKMLSNLYDGSWAKIAYKRRKTKAQSGQDAGLERIIETIALTLEKADISAEQLAGIGVGSPGPLDLERGVLLNAPNLGWQDAPLKDELEKAFGCPAVVINDVDAGVYGEYRFGAARGARCVLGVFPGTGIGGGCVYDGRLIRGRNNSAMEIGHMQVVPDGPLCGCGRHGCLEAVASRLAISAAAAAAAYRGEAPALLEGAGMDLSNIRSGALSAALEAGDRAVETILRDAARWLGVAIGNAINLLAPDKVVLGGGMIEAMPELFLEEITAAAQNRVMPSFVGSFGIVAAQLEDDATAAGAAAYAGGILAEKAGSADEEKKGKQK